MAELQQSITEANEFTKKIKEGRINHAILTLEKDLLEAQEKQMLEKKEELVQQRDELLASIEGLRKTAEGAK